MRAARRSPLAALRPARRTARAILRPLRRVWRLTRRATRLATRFALLACLFALGIIHLLSGLLIFPDFLASLPSRAHARIWDFSTSPKVPLDDLLLPDFTAGLAVDTSKPTLKQKAYHELKEFLGIALYLWVILALFQLYRSLLLREEHLSAVAHQGFAIINALALGKVLLIAKALHLGEWIEDWPLIYPTLLKSALFTIVLACFKILEDAGLGMCRGKSFQESIADLGGGTLNEILCVSLIMFVVLIPFFVLTELQGVFGEGKLLQLFFRPRDSVKPSTDQSADVGN